MEGAGKAGPGPIGVPADRRSCLASKWRSLCCSASASEGGREEDEEGWREEGAAADIDLDDDAAVEAG